MNELTVWVSQWHPGLVIGGSAFVFIFILLCLWELSIRSRFKKIIREAEAVSSGRAGSEKKLKPVSPLVLRLHVRWLERLAKKKKIPIMQIFDFREPWLDKFKSEKRRKDLLRLVDFYPEYSLFPCFEVCLRHKGRGEDFRKILGSRTQEESFFLLKKLAASCGGRDFDSGAAKELLSAYVNSLQELSGDSDWTIRDFAVSILLHDDDPRSHRLLWEAMGDAHAHIRSAAAKGFRPPQEDRERLFTILFALFLNDPSIEVRKAAKARLTAEFADLYKLGPDTLKGENVFHVIDLLDTTSKEDENLALFYLDDSDPEICLSSARFLEAAGTLKRLLLSVDFGDREMFLRTKKRLEKSASVNILGFLSELKNTDNPASLMLAGKLLTKSGDRSLIASLTEKTFTLVSADKLTAELLELYQTSLQCIKARGNLDSVLLLKDELKKQAKAEALRALIWESIPPSFEEFFIADMILVLQEGNTGPEESFRAAWKNFSASVSVPPLLDLLKSGTDLPLSQKRLALEILGDLQIPGLLQTILESLPSVPGDQIPQLCALLSSLDEKQFLLRAGNLLRSVDSVIRSAVLKGLTSGGKKEYLKEIREALNDADPDVRLAAFTSLSEYDEAKILNTNAVKLLRDPVERVRTGVALALGKVGSEATIEELKNLILSKKEAASVRNAGILGLGESPLSGSIDVLLEGAELWLSSDMSVNEFFTRALMRKNDKRQIQYLIEKFKDGNVPARNLIASALTGMGASGESILMDLLNEDIASLKPVICQALEESGIVDIFIRQLGSREPALRREAAGKLAAIGTAKAFRGIVQAARDPSPEIRVLVTKALESLNTPAGTGILKELESDPDKRVRKYTAWAMERIKAKSL